MADYVNSSSPSSSQMNSITSSGAAKVWSVSSNSLSLTSTGSNGAFATRTTVFTTVPVAIQFTFDLVLLSSSSALTSAIQFYFGTGFSTGNSPPTNSTVFSKFGINLTNSSGFSLRDISGSTSGSTTYTTGTYAITFVSNNSGSSLSYLAPDGTTETLANDTWDVWVGTSRQLNDRAATTATSSITDFKFGADGNGTYSVRLDNLKITSIPEPAALILALLALCSWPLRGRPSTPDPPRVIPA